MYIQDLEDTPNPDAKRFVLDVVVIPPYRSLHYTDVTATDHDLATPLLNLPGVVEVFLQGNWVTITRNSNTSWDGLLRRVAEVLRNYEPCVDSTIPDAISQLPDDDPRVPLIRLVLDQEVMPYLNSHGGSLELLTLEGSNLQVRYQGACSGCPASETGTLLAIQAILQREVDPDLTVEAL